MTVYSGSFLIFNVCMSKKKTEFHESFDRSEKFVLGSDRKFGLVFAAVCFFLSISTKLAGSKFRIVLLLCSLGFLGAALLDSKRLRPLNEAWARFGIFLGKIISPIFLGVLFYFAFVPVGFVLRIFKKDILDLKLSKTGKTYWINSREIPESSMKDQF